MEGALWEACASKTKARIVRPSVSPGQLPDSSSVKNTFWG